jgi:hypothetical protein
MIVLQKKPNEDFVILNLTDPQLGTPEWEEGHLNRKILEYTVAQLVEKVKPDLITITGDLAWAGQEHAYKMFGDLMETFQTPWAFVWGNHDAQNGVEFLHEIAQRYLKLPHCLFEEGDPALGNGNYVLAIQENGKPVEAFVMMDTHSQEDYTDAEGNTRKVWSKLTKAQLAWCEEQVEILKANGYKAGTLMIHIPIYGYQQATDAAYKQEVSRKDLTMEASLGADCWNAGYEDSIGVQHEGIACYPEDEGALAMLKKGGLIKRIFAGHDHVNNWMIRYEGIDMVYSLKTGAGCYWEPWMNGGTVLKINEKGIYSVTHEFIDVSHLLK